MSGEFQQIMLLINHHERLFLDFWIGEASWCDGSKLPEMLLEDFIFYLWGINLSSDAMWLRIHWQNSRRAYRSRNCSDTCTSWFERPENSLADMPVSKPGTLFPGFGSTYYLPQLISDPRRGCSMRFREFLFFPFCFSFFFFFRRDLVRAISLEPLLAETPNWVCCLVLRSNFALLLTIQFALLFFFF